MFSPTWQKAADCCSVLVHFAGDRLAHACLWYILDLGYFYEILGLLFLLRFFGNKALSSRCLVVFLQIGFLCQCNVLWETIYLYMATVDSTEYMIFFVKICVSEAASNSWPCPLSFNLISYFQGQFWKLVCSFYLCLNIELFFSLLSLCCNFIAT